MKNKVLLSAIIGGVVYFLLGWLIYGILLKDMMDQNSGLPVDIRTKVFKPMDQMNMPLMLVANLLSGFLTATVLNWGNMRSAGAGLKGAAILGFLVACSYDLMFYSMSYMFTMKGMIIDIVAGTVMMALGGAVIGWMLGRGNK